MKLLRLELLAFGPFTNRGLDLSAGEQGLHLIYGPNEAGKSTARRAVADLLFDYHRQTPDAYLHGYKALQLGGTLQDADGHQLRLIRHKRDSNKLVDPETKMPVPERDLTRMLGGLDKTAFEKIFGIDHQALRDGGAELLRLKGLVGETLFAASLGGATLSQTLRALDDDAAELCTKGGRRQRIPATVKAIKDAEERRRQEAVSSEQWQQLLNDQQQARQHHDNLSEQLLAAQKHQRRLKRLHDVLPLLRQHQPLAERVAELIAEGSPLPEDYDPDQRKQWQQQRRDAAQRIQELTREIDGADGLRQRLADVQPPEGLLKRAETVEDLLGRVGQHRSDAAERPELLAERETQRQAAWAHLQALGYPDTDVADDPDALAQRCAALSREREIRRLAKQRSDRAKQRDQLREQRETLAQRIGDLEAERAKLPPSRDPEPLREVIQRVLADGDLTQRHRDAAQDHADAAARLDRDLARLPHFTGSAAELEALALPDPEDLDRFETAFSELQHERKTLSDRLAELRREHERIDQALRFDAEHAPVPDAADLTAAREARDARWQNLRQHWDEREADGYEADVRHADDLADRLRSDADRVAQRLEQQRQRADLSRQITEAERQLAELDATQASQSAAWQKLWQPLGITQPDLPKAMRTWCTRAEKLRELADQVRTLAGQTEQLAATIAEHRHRLAVALSEAGTTDPPDGELLPDRLDRAQRRLVQLDDLERRRSELARDLEEAARKAEDLDQGLSDAVDALAEAQRAWAEAVAPLGLSGEAAAEEADERLAELQGLQAAADAMRRLDADLTRRDERMARFSSEVQRLASDLAPELPDPATRPDPLSAPVDAVTDLAQRLQQARRDHEQRQSLHKQLAKAEADRKAAQSRRDAAERGLQGCLQAAGAEHEDELPVIEQRNREIREGQRRLHELEAVLARLGDGGTPASLRAEAETAAEEDPALADPDAVAAALSQQAEAVQQLVDDRESAKVELERANDAVAAVDGRSVAAEAEQEIEHLRARLHEDAEEFLSLKLAAGLLKAEIERHRRGVDDPLLARCGELFARLTVGRYTGLRIDYDESDQPVLRAARAADAEALPGEALSVEQLSDGTRDQLFLALRLAYVERRLAQQEPMPLVLDDILVHFDDERSRATLAVLAELSQQTQILYFTHHRHMVDLATDAVPEGQRFTHELDAAAVSVGEAARQS